MALTCRERFLAKVAKQPNGCWLWTAARMAKGYGVFTWRRSDRPTPSRLAHRIAYVLFRGPIPGNLPLDHVVCDTPACVNPWHTEPRTQRENVLRGSSPAAQNARKTHCPVGHRYTEATTMYHGEGKRRCRVCKRLQAEQVRVQKHQQGLMQRRGQWVPISSRAQQQRRGWTRSQECQ